MVFIRLFNKEPKLLIVEHFIGNGYVVADFKLEFDEFGKVKNNYKINGLVNDGEISLLKKKLNKINFIFQVTDKEFKFNEIRFLLNNKNITIPQIIALRQNNEILVSGKLTNKDLKLKEDEIKDYVNNEFLNINLKEIIFSSDNDFTFKIDKNFRFKNFDIKSIINIDNLKIKNFLKFKNNFLKIKNEIIFENQKLN